LIDIHTHILPYIDDGAQNFEEALHMANNFAKKGVKKIIATPHNLKGENFPKSKKILDLINKLNKKIKKQQFDLEILPGAEIYLTPTLDETIKEYNFLSLNNTEYLLIELPMYFLPPYFDRIIYNLQVMGYTPIIAHPERYLPVIKNQDLLSNWIDKGVYIQLNAGSIQGVYGSKVKKTAESILKKRLAHFIASDSHCKEQKRGSLNDGLNKLEKILSKKEKNIFIKNSQNLIDGGKITTITSSDNNESFLESIKYIFNH